MQARLRMREGGFFVRLVWLVDGDLYTFFFFFFPLKMLNFIIIPAFKGRGLERRRRREYV